MWKQTRAFNLSKMGKTKNFCLRNVRLAYDIPAKYANAKMAMNENKNRGTLHDLSSVPTNCSVPVFTDKGIFGHVIVCDKGTYYSDGYKTSKPNNSYKWGEFLNGVRVVSWSDESSIKVGDTVIVSGQGTGNSYGTGGKTKNFANRKMKVINIANGRYGCNQYNRMGAITGWWTSGQIKKG